MTRVPSHVAIIPDGNRRCATRLMKNPSKGHVWGVEKIKDVFKWSKELGIRTITYYSLSLENIEKRPKMELKFLYRLAKKELDDIISSKDNFVHKNRIKMRFFGKTELLPGYLRDAIKEVTKLTENYDDYRINFAIAYGGRQEIIDASTRIGYAVATGILRPDQIDEAVLRSNLSTDGDPDPDLIIRTGKEKRLSNFLLFQSAYSEFAFSDSLWPDFSREEFRKIIGDFTGRDRRFGK
jgi:tritrans,polycis-undecaprenyl-diphosphate synthase [geranylgeranyl-diphosphate specific]